MYNPPTHDSTYMQEYRVNINTPYPQVFIISSLLQAVGKHIYCWSRADVPK